MTRSAMPRRPSAARPVLAHVVISLDPGGTEKLVVDMSVTLAAQFRVHVICLDEPGLWARDLRQRGIPVTCLWRQPGFDAALPLTLARALRACGAQIVHAHQCTPWFYAALSRIAYPRPRLLLEEHGRLYPEADSLVRRLFGRFVLRRLTHRFVAVSQDVRDRLRRFEGLGGAAIDVIYNGVVTEPPLGAARRHEIRRELGFGPEQFVVGTVGRFDPIKNVPMLARCLAKASERQARIHGLLVGDGPQLAPVRALIAEIGLAERVRLTGFRSDARTLVQCLDLFVLSSLSEGTSMALLEAVAAGVPVAVTAVGGNPEIVLDGRTGWVVPSQDEGAMTAAILEAAGDAELCRERALEGRKRLMEHFDFGAMICAYVQLYQALLAGANRPAPIT